MQNLAVDAQLGTEHVIYLHHVFAEVEGVGQVRQESEGIGGANQIRRREFGKEVFDVGSRDRIDRSSRNTRAVSLTSTRSTVAICPLRADHVVELPDGHPGIRKGAGL